MGYDGFWSSPHEFVSLAHLKNKVDSRVVCSLTLLMYEAFMFFCFDFT